MTVRKNVYVECRENMIWLPVLAMTNGVPVIGEYAESCGRLTEDEIQEFTNYCTKHNLNWCIAERI